MNDSPESTPISVPFGHLHDFRAESLSIDTYALRVIPRQPFAPFPDPTVQGSIRIGRAAMTPRSRCARTLSPIEAPHHPISMAPSKSRPRTPAPPSRPACGISLRSRHRAPTAARPSETCTASAVDLVSGLGTGQRSDRVLHALLICRGPPKRAIGRARDLASSIRVSARARWSGDLACACASSYLCTNVW